jgi:hypothetical protein
MTASAFIDLSNGKVAAELLLEIGEEVAQVEAELARQVSNRVATRSRPAASGFGRRSCPSPRALLDSTSSPTDLESWAHAWR